MSFHTMTIKSIIPLLLFSLLACGRPVSAGGYSPEAGNSADISKIKTEILSLINDYRRENGNPLLQQNSLVERIADQHSLNMAKGKVAFGHNGFDTRNKQIKQQIGSMSAMAENVAFGKLTASRVVDLWLSSTGHRKNIEGNYNTTGIGIAKADDGQLYFTQLFILK